MGRWWALSGCVGLFLFCAAAGCGSTAALGGRYRVDTPRVIEGSSRGIVPSDRVAAVVREMLEDDGERIVACFDGLGTRRGAAEPQDVTAHLAITLAGPMLAGVTPRSPGTVIDDLLRSCLDQVVSTWPAIAVGTEAAALDVRLRVVPSLARPAFEEAPATRFIPAE